MNSTNRRYELDWLRVSAILIVFLYHTTRFFNLGDWHVKNATIYTWVEAWNIFSMSWLMPLFFTISGAGLFLALDKIEKSNGFSKFYTDKFLRLMIPVLVATVSHGAVQVYLERLSHDRFWGSFFAFIPEYFDGVYLGIGLPGNFAFVGMHLWYLLFLFVYSLMCYHLFLRLKTKAKGFLDRLTAFFATPGWIYFGFTIPLLIMKAVIPEVVLSAGAGAWGFVYYLWFLIAGFMIVSSQRLQQVIRQQYLTSLILAIGLSTAYLYLKFISPHTLFSAWWAGHWPRTLIYFTSTWCWLLTILGFGMRFLSFNTPWLRHANEAVLPFYILHQFIIVVIGYFVVGWAIHDWIKWAIIFVGSFIVIITLYAALIRKIELLRFLFGMKTSHTFFSAFKKWGGLIAAPILYIGLIGFAIYTGCANRAPMPLIFDRQSDIVLNCDTLGDASPKGVQVLDDPTASNGKAISFTAGANQLAQQAPQVWLEFTFEASKGLFWIWLRGKSDEDKWTDSLWLQVDDQIATAKGSIQMGNWRDIHPAGVYAWAGNGASPVPVALKYSGEHTIRLQPRQIPHNIDQIWISRRQRRIPDTDQAISFKENS